MKAKEILNKIDTSIKKHFSLKGQKKFGKPMDKVQESGFTYSWQKKDYWKGIEPGKNPNAEHHEGDGG